MNDSCPVDPPSPPSPSVNDSEILRRKPARDFAACDARRFHFHPFSSWDFPGLCPSFFPPLGSPPLVSATPSFKTVLVQLVSARGPTTPQRPRCQADEPIRNRAKTCGNF